MTPMRSPRDQRETAKCGHVYGNRVCVADASHHGPPYTSHVYVDTVWANSVAPCEAWCGEDGARLCADVHPGRPCYPALGHYCSPQCSAHSPGDRYTKGKRP